MGYRIDQSRHRGSRRWWLSKNPSVVWDADAFERASTVLLAGNRRSVTAGEVASLMTRACAWVATTYELPAERDLATRGSRAKPWHKDDEDPNAVVQGYMDAGRASEGMATLATAMGFVATAIAATHLAGLVLYGAGAMELGFAGVSLFNRAAIHGAQLHGMISVQMAPGALGPRQLACLMRLIKSEQSVHRFFNECAPEHGYECRLGVLSALRRLL